MLWALGAEEGLQWLNDSIDLCLKKILLGVETEMEKRGERCLRRLKSEDRRC